MAQTAESTGEGSQVGTIPRFVSDSYHDEIRRDYPGLIARVSTGLDRPGMAVLENFIHPRFLAEMQSSVERLSPLCYEGGKRRPVPGAALEGTPFWEVAFSDFFNQFTNDLLSKFGVHVEAAETHPVVNVLSGELGQDAVRAWHFDATYLTIAMPIVMPPPTGQRDGKFRIWPNVRRFSQSLWRNKVYWNLAKVGFLRRIVRNYAVNFVPGNLYFFYGFRSYHGTEELDTHQPRANCLINFGGPFFDLEKGKIIRYRK